MQEENIFRYTCTLYNGTLMFSLFVVVFFLNVVGATSIERLLVGFAL